MSDEKKPSTSTKPPEGKTDLMKRQVSTIRDLLTRSKDQIAMALPAHMNPERMVRLAMTSVLRNPKLLECDSVSLVGAVIQCSQLGLEPGSNYGAHLVPFWNSKKNRTDVQVIPDYRGLMRLARNSDEVSTFDAHAVFVKDQFEFRYGTNGFLHHVPHTGKDRGDITHFYAIAKLRDGSFQFKVLEKWEVDDIRDRFSKAKDNGPWVTNYVEMGCKTVLRQIVDYLPVKIEAATAAGLIAKADQGIPQDLGSLVDSSVATDLGTAQDEAVGGGELTMPKSNAEAEAPAPPADPPAAPPDNGGAEPEDEEALAKEAREREQAEAQPTQVESIRQRAWRLVEEKAAEKKVRPTQLLYQLTKKQNMTDLTDVDVQGLLALL